MHRTSIAVGRHKEENEMLDRLNMLLVASMAQLSQGLRREEGQAITEYALILALVVVGAAAVLAIMGPRIVTKLTAVSDLFK
jgi:Flp pilus assembly pilin Flp